MLTAVLLAAIGSADLWRSLFRGRTRAGLVLTIAGSWLLIALLVVTGLSVPLGWVALCLLAACGWLALTTADEHAKGRAGRAAVIGLVVIVVALLLADRTGSAIAGYFVDGQRDVASAALRETSIPAVAMLAGVGLFLCESANIVVRIALHTRPEPPVEFSAAEVAEAGETEGATGPAGTDLTSAGLAGTDVTGTDVTGTDLAGTDLTRTDLKGGRLIGPLERLLIVAIVLAGLAPIAAALVAAKGIVRFPEIAQDVRQGANRPDGLSGTKAEYFLVGSLVSWATAAAAVALVVSAQG